MKTRDIKQKFLNKKFGMFIHWGVYSTLGGEWQGKTVGDELGEWIMNVLQIPIKEYEKIAAEFNPVQFNADKLVKLASDAGMQYIVITSKHHDGFAMFHSKCDPYNIVDWTNYKHDVIAELAEACNKYGLKLGFYYSQALDWHEKHAGGWDMKPYGQRISWGNVWDFPDNEEKDFSIYFEKKVKPQVTELLTNYGDIFLMWFDTPRTITEGQSEELYQLVKSIQPDCLVNSRIGNGRGDYGSLGDNQIPIIKFDKPNEAPVTLNDTWGYKYYDQNWKTPDEIIEILIKLASKNVNLLLNIGPTGTGAIPEETVNILNGISEWTAKNSEAIFNTAGNPLSVDFDWGYLTTKQDKLYLYLKENKEQAVEINGLLSKVQDVYSLHNKQQLKFSQKLNLDGGFNSLKINIPTTDRYMPVYVVELEGKPVFESIIQQQNNSLVLYPYTAKIYDGRYKTGKSVVMENRYVNYDSLGRIKLDRGGILQGWCKKDDYLEWEAKFNKPGVYRVEIIFKKLYEQKLLESDCKIKILLAQKRPLIAGLQEDFTYAENRTSKYNIRIGMVCGEINIERPGIQDIKLKLNKDLKPSNEIPLVALRFINIINK